MLCFIDVSPDRRFRKLEDTRGHDGKISVIECLPEVEYVKKEKHDVIIFLEATRNLPEDYEDFCRDLSDFSGKLLVLTSTVEEGEDMCVKCSITAHCCSGHGIRAGDSWGEARIIFATVELVLRWYENYGSSVFDPFGAVQLDKVRRNADYRLLCEVVDGEHLRRKGSCYPFFIVLSTPTMNERQSTSVYTLGSCLLYTSPSPRDRQKSRMPSSA